MNSHAANEPESKSSPAVDSPTEQPKKPYGRNWIKLILVYLIIGALIYAVIYYLVLSNQDSNPSSVPITKTAPSPSITSDPTADWKMYTSEQLGIIFKYPSSWILKDNDTLTSESTSIKLYPPTVSNFLEGIPEKNKSEFAITITKLPDKISDHFQLFGLIDDPKFHHKDYVYSKRSNKSGEGYQMMYREEGLTIPQISKEFGNTITKRDAYYINDNGDVIHIKPGAFVGVNKKFYDSFLQTFKFTEPTSQSSPAKINRAPCASTCDIQEWGVRLSFADADKLDYGITTFSDTTDQRAYFYLNNKVSKDACSTIVAGRSQTKPPQEVLDRYFNGRAVQLGNYYYTIGGQRQAICAGVTSERLNTTEVQLQEALIQKIIDTVNQGRYTLTLIP